METVAVGVTQPSYNDVPPYHPDTAHPELPFPELSSRPNAPYELLRHLFRQLGYDRAHDGTEAWNPLGQIVQPGQTVVLKPNFVMSFNPNGADLFAIVTHPSILRALVDYVYIALKGAGRIIIADAPDMGCDWEQLMAAQRLDTIQEFYRSKFKFELEVYDLRNFAMIDPLQPAYSHNRKTLAGDPQGSVVINLGQDSEFYGMPSNRYYGADYDRTETIRHHQDGIHEYSVSRTVLAAHTVISVPKMKVHKKVGVTLNIKGLVGINTNKNYLIHHRVGSPREGGDQLPDNIPSSDRFVKRTQRWLYDHAMARQSRLGDLVYKTAMMSYRTFARPFHRMSEYTTNLDGGNWYGNDSAWRMAADLAKVIYFSDAQGKIHQTPQRRMFCVVDGIVGGENMGPLQPDPRPCGCLIAGRNLFAVDLVATRLMGFDHRKIRQFSLVQSGRWDFGLHSLSAIEVIGQQHRAVGEGFFGPTWQGPAFDFKPHPGWRGHIELHPPDPVS
jgi:uncharacterized protein (DUF362 family)